MKWITATFPNLHIHGVARFEDGVFRSTDPEVLARMAPWVGRYGVTQVSEDTDPPDLPLRDPWPGAVLDIELFGSDGKVRESVLPPRLSDVELRAAFDAWFAENGGGGGGATTNPALSILHAGLNTRLASPARIVFTGTSLTQGGQYVDFLAATLQAEYPSGLGTETVVIDSTTAAWGTLSTADGVHGYNAGISGATSVGYIPSANVAPIAAIDPVMIVHEIGTNDFRTGVGPATYKANVQARITALKAALDKPCVHVLVHTYERMEAFTPVAPWAAYGQALREIAAADPTNVVYIDVNPDFVAVGVPGADPFDLVSADLVHQTDSGMRFLADLLRRRLGIPQSTAAEEPGVTPRVNILTGSSSTFDVDLGEYWSGDRATVARVTTPTHAGAGALRATAAGGGTAVATRSVIAVAPGITYDVRAWVRADTGTLPMQVSAFYFTDAFAYLGTSTIGTATATATEWTQVATTATPVANSVYMAISVITVSTATAGTIFYVDDVEVLEPA